VDHWSRDFDSCGFYIIQGSLEPRSNFVKFASVSFALLGSILILSGAIGKNSYLDLGNLQSAGRSYQRCIFDGLALVVG
jgi:hypothetical protein